MNEPTKKSPAIDALLTSIAGISRQDAHKQKICTWCKKPLSDFRDHESKIEYRITGFCQACQDATYDE